MKLCIRCGLTKEDGCFNFANRKRDKLSTYCKECLKVYREKNREEEKERKRQWREAHPERLAEYKKKEKTDPKRKIRDKVKLRKAQLKKKGLLWDEYEAKLAVQNHRCEICGQEEHTFKRAFAVDHDHQTGQIRGLLCTNCNTAIGFMKEDVRSLLMAINYLTKYRELWIQKQIEESAISDHWSGNPS